MDRLQDKLLSEPNRISILDGYRGIAVLLVISFHYSTYIKLGWAGVDLFFVLSGFLITKSLINSAGRPYYFRRFYLHRILRIIPLYYLVLLLLFVLLPRFLPFLVTSAYKELVQLHGWYWLFTQNIYNAWYGWPDNITVIHFWSLATEMQFYLVWPLIIIGLYKKTTYLIFLIIMLILMALLLRMAGPAILQLNNLYRYVMLPSRIDAFGAGALVFLLIHIYGQKYKRWFLCCGIFGTLAILVLFAFYWNSNFLSPGTNTYSYTIFDLTWAGWIGFTLLMYKNKAVQKILGGRFLVITGKYSYAMYIFHLPVWIVLKIVLDKYINNDGLLTNVLHQTGALGLTYLLSAFSWEYYEKYFLRLKVR